MTEESLLSLPEFLTHALDRHIHTCHSCTRNDVCTYVCRGFQVASQMPLPRLEEVLCCCRAGNGDDVVSPQQQFAFDLLPLAPFPTTSGRVKVPRLRVLFQGRMTKMFTRVGGGGRRRRRRLFLRSFLGSLFMHLLPPPLLSPSWKGLLFSRHADVVAAAPLGNVISLFRSLFVSSWKHPMLSPSACDVGKSFAFFKRRERRFFPSLAENLN